MENPMKSNYANIVAVAICTMYIMTWKAAFMEGGPLYTSKQGAGLCSPFSHYVPSTPPPPQVSSDIIKRCCSQISLDHVFEGHVEKSRTALQESIQCCTFWKDTYAHTSRVQNKFSSKGWVLDESSIFAHIDAFIQRCKDLLEVVLGQVSSY